MFASCCDCNNLQLVSHCNVSYNLIAKILAKGLCLVLTNIIFPFQSAFV